MGVLDNLLVVSIEQAVAAPLCTARLADAGARVIKIERAEGDFARGYDIAAKGESSYFTWLNQGKESVCLDFKQNEDAKNLWSMLSQADILVQNLSPGALSRSGFTPDALREINPRLIVCNISGYGDSGEAAKKRAYDLLVQAESGIVSVSGEVGAPSRVGISICDIGTGVTTYAAILEAIIRRSTTGVGEHLSVSLFDVATEWMSVPYIHAEYGAGAPEPAGLKHPSIAPYGAFQCSDGKQILISIQNEREWQRLCTDVLRSSALLENKNYQSNNSRVKNRVDLESAINAITESLSSTEFQERLINASIGCGAINSAAELSSHEAFRSRKAVNALGESMQLPAHPVKVVSSEQETPPSQRQATAEKSTPTLGQHTQAIKAEFS